MIIVILTMMFVSRFLLLDKVICLTTGPVVISCAPIAVKFLAVQVRYQLDRLYEKRSITKSIEGQERNTCNKMKEN